MSDQTATFTIQDLASQAAKVIEAVHRLGSVDVRTPEGEVLVLKKKEDSKPVEKQSAEAVLARFDAHWKHLRELGHVPPPPSENERINKIIAGEI